MLLKIIITKINLILMLVAFLFIFVWIYKNFSVFETVTYQVELYKLLISIILIKLFHISQIIVWILSFKSLEIKNNILISKLYLWNNIYNYLPNRIFHFGGTVLLGKNYGFEMKHTAIVIINFQVALLLSGICILLFFLETIPILKNFELLMYIILIIGILVPIIKKHLPLKDYNLKSFDMGYWYLSIIISMISWSFYSLSLYTLFQFLNHNFQMPFDQFSSISIFSNLSGSFVFFMPAGLGALETVFINLIDDIEKTGYFLTTLILFRLLSLISTSCLILMFRVKPNDYTRVE